MLPNAARRLPLQRRVTPHTQKTPFSAFSYNIYPKKLLNHSSAKYDLFAFTPALQDFIHLPNYLRATHYKVHNNILNHLSAKYSKRHICPVRAFLICIAVSFFMQTYSIYRTPYKPTHPSAPLNTTPTPKHRLTLLIPSLHSALNYLANKRTECACPVRASLIASYTSSPLQEPPPPSAPSRRPAYPSPTHKNAASLLFSRPTPPHKKEPPANRGQPSRPRIKKSRPQTADSPPVRRIKKSRPQTADSPFKIPS